VARPHIASVLKDGRPSTTRRDIESTNRPLHAPLALPDHFLPRITQLLRTLGPERVGATDPRDLLLRPLATRADANANFENWCMQKTAANLTMLHAATISAAETLRR
jgi:hypothetical protein